MNKVRATIRTIKDRELRTQLGILADISNNLYEVKFNKIKLGTDITLGIPKDTPEELIQRATNLYFVNHKPKSNDMIIELATSEKVRLLADALLA